MTATTASRENILSAIRGALGPPTVDRDAAWTALPRDYRSAATLPMDERITLLEDRLRDYGAGVHQCTESEISTCVAGILTCCGKNRLAIPEGLPSTWLPPGFEWIEADQLLAFELDTLDGIISAATLAIAETGTILLQTLPAQGPRKLSLVPDFHLLIVRAHDVVETVPEAFERIRATSSLPTTFISGPSATADIEMTRIKGVHGPRVLEVLLVNEDAE